MRILQAYLQLATDNLVIDRIRMPATCEWRRLIEQGASIGDHLRATHRVIGARTVRAIRLCNDIRAIQCIVQRTPARIGGIERIPRVLHGHHELGTREGRDFIINIRSGDREIRAFRQQITDLFEKFLVLRSIMRRIATRLMPGIDLCLQLVALQQQDVVLRREFGNYFFKHRPKRAGLELEVRQDLVYDELIERIRNLHAAVINAGVGGGGIDGARGHWSLVHFM